MKPSSQNPQQYRFVERGHGDITADVVDDADLGTALWIQTSVNGCYLRPNRIDELGAGLHSAAGEKQVTELATLRSRWLTEAIEAARGEYLTDATGDETDEAYNRGVADAIAAIDALIMSDATTPRRAPDPWVPIFRLVGWLDRENGRSQHEISMRLLKLVEEAGEVAQAYIGTIGQNPRKGITHTKADLADELCDVIITAMVALVSVVDGNPDDILAAKLDKVTKRSAASEGGAA